MQHRTRVVAWIFLVYSALCMLFLLWIVFVAESSVLGFEVVLRLPNAVVWVFWLFLLRERKWAWWALVTTYAGMAVLGLLFPILPVCACSDNQGLEAALASIIPTVLVPLIFLLTDPPSGWTKHEEDKA